MQNKVIGHGTKARRGCIVSETREILPIRRKTLQIAIALTTLGCVLAAAGHFKQRQSASTAYNGTLEGDWEALISYPRRPYVIKLHFDSVQGHLQGEWESNGRRSPTEIHTTKRGFSFKGTIDNTEVRLDGVMLGNRIVGTATDPHERVPFVMEREPQLPVPGDRAEAWRQDLEITRRKLPKYDRSFSEDHAAEFQRAISVLAASAREKTDDEMIVQLARAVALSGNAHTRLILSRGNRELPRYPLRFWWFRDGLFVVKAMDSYRSLLGCRVKAIEGRQADDVRSKLDPLVAGNEAHKTYWGPYLLTLPSILLGLHLVGSLEDATFTFDCSAGSTRRRVRAMSAVNHEWMSEPWWELAPQRTDPGFVSVLGSVGLPMYLANSRRFYSFDYDASHELLYFQFNTALDDPWNEPMESFSRRLLGVFDEHHIGKLVIDLRFNAGGNLGVARKLMSALQQKCAGTQVFVLIGRATFSAGLFHAAQWKQWGHAVFVGEPAGDDLDFWAEGGNIELPNSHLAIRYSNGFHRYSKTDYPERRPYYMELALDSLVPDVPVSMSFHDYQSGQDALLNAVLAYGGRNCSTSLVR